MEELLKELTKLTEVANREKSSLVDHLRIARRQVTTVSTSEADPTLILHYLQLVIKVLVELNREEGTIDTSSPHHSQLLLYGLQTISNTFTAFPSIRELGLTYLVEDEAYRPFIVLLCTILKSSSSDSKLVEVILVLFYNVTLDSLTRSERFYRSQGGQLLLLELLKTYPHMTEQCREIGDGLIQNLFKEGLFQVVVDNPGQEETGMLRELPFEILNTVCLSQDVRDYTRYFPTTLTLFTRTVETTVSLLKQCHQNPDLTLTFADRFLILHTQLQVWLEWFYLVSVPDTDHGKILNHDPNLSLPLVTVYLTLIRAMDQYLPKIHTIQLATTIQPSPSTLTGIMTCTLRALSHLTSRNPPVQNKVRELNGLPLLLNQCNIDDNHPYLREHALFNIHQLVVTNPTNADLVRQLAPQGPAPHPVLQELGLAATLSPTGQPHLKPKPPNP